MRIVSKTELQPVISVAKRRIAEVRDRYSINVDDPDYGEAFLFYLLFTNFSNLLDMTLADSETFHNRFYWFVQFALLYTAKHGADVGIEQQYFSLLDEAETVSGVDIELLYELRHDICGDRSFFG
jgi:hypothetical protein